MKRRKFITQSTLFALGHTLKIYPVIKSLKTDTYFEGFTRNYLNVGIGATPIAKQEVDTTNKPAKVGQVETNVANFNPCQYTAIHLIDDKGKSTSLFKEDSSKLDKATLETGIILGQDPKKFILKVDENSQTVECGKKQGVLHVNMPIIIMAINGNDTTPNGAKLIVQEEKKSEFEVGFNYGNTFEPFKYFFLPSNYMKSNLFNKLTFYSATCRHQHKINITILPDIEWELAFIITTSAGFRIKADKTVYTRLQQGLGEYGFKGIKVEQAGKLIEKGGVGYSLITKYSINGGNHVEQISLEFVRNIEKIISTYDAILKFASFFKSDEPSNTSAAIQTGTIKKFTFDIEPPAIVFLLKWKYDYAKKNKQPVVSYTGAAGFKPLIGIKIGFDIMQNLEIFGVGGEILDFINRYVINKLFKKDLYVLAEVGAAINYDIGLSYNEIDGFDDNTKQKVTAELKFSFKAGIKDKRVIYVANTRRMQGNEIPTNEAEEETFKIEGAISTGVRYTEEHGFTKGKGSYEKTEVKWLGALMTITIVTLSTKRKMNQPQNNQSKKDFNLLDAYTIYGPETIYQKNEK